MNLNTHDWKPFIIEKLFTVKYGVNLELSNCDEIINNDEIGIKFVSRTESNNGVSATVKPIEGVTPQREGLISVAGGGSVLSTFIQPEPFYSGRDLYTLEAKENISFETKMFIITIIKANKYKYSYGRQANKTLPYLELMLPVLKDNNNLPIIDDTNKFSNEGYIPDWQFMENYIKSLHYKPLTTKQSVVLDLNEEKWEAFTFGRLIDKIYKAHAYTKDELNEQDIKSASTLRYITRTAEDNGCELIVKNEALSYIEDGNAITIGDTTATCFYQEERFVTGDHMIVIRADWLNTYIGLFIVSLLNYEQYRYSYGRAYLIDRVKETVLKLPICRNNDGLPIIDATKRFSNEGYIPDWQFMEEYIKSLPYGDRIKIHTKE